MDIQKEIQDTGGFLHLDLLARQVVEGYISGIHKSPFHGFSAEFAEHKIYNNGESTRHIDWKLFAKTDKLYTRRYEEETNLRWDEDIYYSRGEDTRSYHFVGWYV